MGVPGKRAQAIVALTSRVPPLHDVSDPSWTPEEITPDGTVTEPGGPGASLA